jgi:hypothetical protein
MSSSKLCTILKGQRNAISSLLAEVCAVRDSLIEIGPKYADILKRHRESHIQASTPLVSADLRRIDEIIQKLKLGSKGSQSSGPSRVTRGQS